MLRVSLKGFLDEESGATAIEYGLIVAILGLGLAMGLEQVRTGIWGLYVDIKGGLNL